MADSDSTPLNPKSRARAYRLRARLRKGDTLEVEDAVWLGDYEKQTNAANDFGASASERTIHVEEKRMAVGTGAAAEVAAAAAMAREEGRRLDYLTKAAIDALVEGRQVLVAAATQSREAAAVYGLMVKDLLSRTKALEEVHLSMLDSVREQYLARTQAEVDAVKAENAENKESSGTHLERMLEAFLVGQGVIPGPPEK